MTYPSFAEEEILWKKGLIHIAGIDEVGRGAFAGPLVAAAVILPQSFPQTLDINDSKLLSAQKREVLGKEITKRALTYAISTVSVNYINRFGVGKATQLAFRKAIMMLSLRPDFLLIDAFYVDRVAKRLQKPIIKGDSISISIAAASIIAKIYRDSLMQALGNEWSKYEFAVHKGYGTKRHQILIKQFGLSSQHRLSFALDRFLS